MTAPDPDHLLAAAVVLLTVAILVGGALTGWRAWLSLRRLQIDTARRPTGDLTHPATRIDLADLKERVRRLEAIAAGVDL